MTAPSPPPPIVRRIRVLWTESGPVIDPGYEMRRRDDPWIGSRQPGTFAWDTRNLKEMLHGRAPFGNDGARIVLHHRGHFPCGPIDEYSAVVYRQFSRSDPTPEERRLDLGAFAAHHARYWVTRALAHLGALPEHAE